MKTVFIVPYRNRHQHKFFFIKHMSFLLENYDKSDYEILFIHQCDKRNFNRGAMKNIGFLICKEKYPESYQDITLIFHDVDTLPFHKLFDYNTTENTIQHYYGFNTALGGIFAIKAGDFEKTKGFPNYWGWGMEDACFQKRCLAAGLNIDRSNFYEIGNPNILQFFDGVNRIVSQRDYKRMITDNRMDGFKNIHRLSYEIVKDGQSLNSDDNKFLFQDSSDQNNINIVNVTSFITINNGDKDEYYAYDLRDSINKIFESNTVVEKGVDVEWTNIPSHERTNFLHNVTVKKQFQQQQQQQQQQQHQQQQQQQQQQ